MVFKTRAVRGGVLRICIAPGFPALGL